MPSTASSCPSGPDCLSPHPGPVPESWFQSQTPILSFVAHPQEARAGASELPTGRGVSISLAARTQGSLCTQEPQPPGHRAAQAGPQGPLPATRYFLRLLYSLHLLCVPLLGAAQLSTVCSFLHSLWSQRPVLVADRPRSCVPSEPADFWNPQDYADVIMLSSLTLLSSAFCSWC